MGLPGELAPELYDEIKALEIRAQRLVDESLVGRYESAFKGRGMELLDVRPYHPGDSVRFIDWHVTARTGQPHVQRHREERELRVHFLVDLSGSGSFGSVEKSKREVAAEVTALLAWAATASNDPVGLVAFTDKIEFTLPPRKGPAQVWRLIRTILALEPAETGTDLAGALDYLGRLARRRSVVFVVSDFLTRGYRAELSHLASRHDVTALVIVDPHEEKLPPLGLVEIEDAETGERRLIDSSSPALAAAAKAQAASRARHRSELFRSLGVDELILSTDRPYIETLLAFFRARERRLRR